MDKNNLTLLRLFKVSASIYFKNVFIWLLICLFIYLPMWVCFVFGMARFDLSVDLLQVLEKVNFYDIIILSLPFVLFNCLATAAISSVVQQNIFNKKADLKVVLDDSLLKWGKLVATSFLYFAILGISYSIPILFIFFAVVFYFYAVVVALSGYDCFKAMRICWLSMKGHWFDGTVVIFLCSFARFYLRFFLSEFVRNYVSSMPVYFAVYVFLSEVLGVFLTVFLIVWFLSIAMAKIEGDKNKISA